MTQRWLFCVVDFTRDLELALTPLANGTTHAGVIMMKKTLIPLFVFALLIAPQVCQTAWAGEKGIHAQIDELVKERDFSAAESKAKDYLQVHPDSVEGKCALACVYRNRSRKSAVNVNTDAMGIKEGESGQYAFEGSDDVKKLFSEKLYFDTAEHQRAEQLYFEIIRQDPSYQNAYFNLLNDYVVVEDFASYFKIIDLYVTNLKQHQAAAYNLNDLAAKLIEKNFYDQALRLLAIVVRNFPDYHEARSDMGAVYSRQGKIEQARNIFREVYKSHPEDEVNLLNYCFTSVLSEDFATAYRLNEKIAQLDGHADRLYDQVFLAVLLQRDYGPDLNAYLTDRKTRVENVDEDFWYQSAQELSRLEQRSKEKRLSFLEYLLSQFNEAGYPSMTIIAANLVEQIEPTNFALMVHTSVFDQNNYLEKTVEYLDKIRARRESDPSIMSEADLNWNYGRIYYAADKYAEAQKYFAKNQNKDKADARINYYLGKCYLALHQPDEAKKLFEINSKMNDKEQMTFINYSIRELERM